jgi:hypothetical protein
MTISYERVGSSDRLFSQNDVGGNQLSAFWAATPPSQSNLALSDTWGLSGVYLFAPQIPTDLAGFQADLSSVLIGTQARFVWINNPNDPVQAWVVQMMQVDMSGKLLYAAQFQIGSNTLVISRQVTLTLGATSFTLNLTVPEDITYQSANGQVDADGGSAHLSMNGATVGCLQFGMTLHSDADLQVLDVSLRMFYESSVWSGYLDVYQYPIFTLNPGPGAGSVATSIPLLANIDPSNLMDASRSYFAFTDTSIAIATGYRTIYGQWVSVQPAAATALVFQRWPQALQPTASDAIYLVPSGDFKVVIPNSQAGETQFMCGLSGLEYTLFPVADGIMTFVPNSAAYSPLFGKQVLPPQTDALKTDATTAWVSLSAPSPFSYYAQPDDASLYQSSAQANNHTGPLVSLVSESAESGYRLQRNTMSGALVAQLSSSGSDTPFLLSVQPVAGQFPAQDNAAAFPMLPYGLVNSQHLDDLNAFETGVLSPARRAKLNTFLLPLDSLPDTGSALAGTPQGLLYEFDSSFYHIHSLTLAQLDGGAQKLVLSRISGDFKAALQTNQLFAVISNPDVFIQNATVQPPFSLKIEDWTFNFNPDSWAAHKTLMLIKYAGKSIAELVKDSSTWTWQSAATGYGKAAADNNTLEDVQRDLINLLKDAGARSDTNFVNFNNVVNNPNWNGILFLHVNMNAQDLPPALRGLAAGIDPNQFYAHHVGLNATPLQVNGQQIQQADSSLFGLIFYEDLKNLYYNNRPYDYKVTSLKVLFENSQIANFFSSIQLLIAELFGETPILDTPDDGVQGNTLILNGFYQQQGTSESYVFVQVGSNHFQMHNTVLESIDISQAQFVTLGSTDVIRGRFTLTGVMRFVEQPAFDIFSFGNTYETDKAGKEVLRAFGGLAFSNLIIDMQYNTADVKQPPQFTFNAGVLALDLVHSVARDESLYNHFPLKLIGLLQAPQDTKPGDLGYISIKSPLRQAGLEYPWYALTFMLDLGTLGALAGDVGFVITLVAAWQPDISDTKTYVGIKLPGSNSANAEIPIEGVLKLSMKGIEFTANTDSDGNMAYLLRFRSIALKIFILSFPPGQTDIYLFGDPAQKRSDVLAWYAAYAKDEKKKGE